MFFRVIGIVFAAINHGCRDIIRDIAQSVAREGLANIGCETCLAQIGDNTIIIRVMPVAHQNNTLFHHFPLSRKWSLRGPEKKICARDMLRTLSKKFESGKSAFTQQRRNDRHESAESNDNFPAFRPIRAWG